MLRRAAVIAALALAALPTTAAAAIPGPAHERVRAAGYSDQPDVARITYRREIGNAVLLRSWYTAWNGRTRALLVAYPARSPARGVPLLVTNHPAGLSMYCTDRHALAAVRGGFALACLAGQGTATRAFSYGAAGQIADLARAPQFVALRAPDLRIDQRRLYLAGSSMGATETLLVALRYPHAYDGVVSLDPITDLGRRYWSLPLDRRALMADECGGSPLRSPLCYAVRSPAALVRGAAAIPPLLSLWYSPADPVSGDAGQAPAFAAALRARGLATGFVVHVGIWHHGTLWDRARYRHQWLRELGLRPTRGS